MEDLIDALESELKKRITVEVLDERFEEIGKQINTLSAINKVAIWKWESSDISFKGEVLPSENPVNTLENDCVWDGRTSRIKIMTSGTYQLTLFVRYQTHDRPQFSICLNDEPFYMHEQGENEQDNANEFELSKFLILEAGKTITLFYQRKCYSGGVLTLKKL